MERAIYIKYKIENLITVSKIVTINCFSYGKNFYFPGEYHDFWEMVYLEQGQMIATANEKDFLLKPGEAIFHKPNEVHKLCGDGQNNFTINVITFECNSPAMEYFRNKIISLSTEAKLLLKKYIEESKRVFKNPCFDKDVPSLRLREDAPLGGQQFLKMYLEQLLLTMLRDGNGEKTIFFTKESMENHIVAVILDYLEKQIYGTFSIESLCRYMNYGKTYLCTIFKKNKGCGIYQYYLNLKIEEAKKLLRKENQVVTQVSDLLQFDNPHYFAAVFKRVTGVTPTEYRQAKDPFP